MGKQDSKNSNNKILITNADVGRFKVNNSKDILSLYQDPTYLGFKIFFRGINDANTGGLLGAASNPNSARYYLKQIGDNARFKMLDTFVNMLQKINTEYPWYFQSITGLDEAWKVRSEFMHPRVKKQFTVNCLEALDLRMTSLIDLYRKSAYDWVNTREVLTDNLRHFEVDIMVYDMRTFSKSLSGEDIEGKSTGDVSRDEEVNNVFLGDNEFEQSHFIFHMGFVQINLESGANIFSNIANNQNEAAAQSIIFDYELIEESNLYKILTMLYRSDNEKYWYVKDYVGSVLSTLSTQNSGKFDYSSLGGSQIQVSPVTQTQIDNNTVEKNKKFNVGKEIGKLYDPSSIRNQLTAVKEDAARRLENVTDNFLNNIKKDVTGAVKGFIESEINNLLLGNVYDFSAANLLAKGDRNLDLGKIVDDRLNNL